MAFDPDCLKRLERTVGTPNFRKAVSNEAMSLIQRIKQAFDPLGLLDSGKIFPASMAHVGEGKQ